MYALNGDVINNRMLLYLIPSNDILLICYKYYFVFIYKQTKNNIASIFDHNQNIVNINHIDNDYINPK